MINTGSLTTSGDLVVVTIDGDDMATIAVDGTYTGLTIQFAGSDNRVSYYPVAGMAIKDGMASYTFSPADNSSQLYLVSLLGLRSFEVLASALTSGSATVRIISSRMGVPIIIPVAGTSATGATNLAQVGGAAVGIGQAAALASLPVVLASNQTLPLPAGASTGAKQDTGNTSLASLDGKVVACNTGAVTISAALPAGSATIGGITAADGAIASLGLQSNAAAADDTSSATLIALFKRLLGRITTMLAQLPTALTGSGNLKVSIAESTATLINTEATVIASAAQTASFNSSDQTNLGSKGVILTLDVTAVSGTLPTLDVQIQYKDAASGKYVNILTAAFVQAILAGTQRMHIYPGLTGTLNISHALPKTWRAACTIGGTGSPSFTFSLGASYVF